MKFMQGARNFASDPPTHKPQTPPPSQWGGTHSPVSNELLMLRPCLLYSNSRAPNLGNAIALCAHCVHVWVILLSEEGSIGEEWADQLA